VDEPELSYELFRKAAEIDLGPNMKSSDGGIHSASLGGIWQIVACGFGGLRISGRKLRIDPKLPAQIRTIRYPVSWKGNALEIEVRKKSLTIENKGSFPVEIIHGSQTYVIKDRLEITY
jgi:hypothetical glycosyl hydrolase